MTSNIEELKLIINQIRICCYEYRKNNQLKATDFFFISMLEVTSNLTELGIESNRRITWEEEENWFKGSYHLDFWDSEINNNLYIPLITKVTKLNFFRTPK